MPVNPAPSLITRRRICQGATALLVSGCAADGGPAGWTAHDPNSQQQVDHRAWQVFLDRNTRPRGDGVTLVAYGEVPTVDRELLDDYLGRLRRVPVGALSRREQLAFWLNLHNALVVRVVLDNLMVRSVDDIRGPGLFPVGVTRSVLIRVAGRPISLTAIRREALAPVFQDPRWHYGLCDGTIGGPSLVRTAYTGSTVDRALETAAIDFIAHPRAVRRDPDRAGGLLLNALWRRSLADFGGTLEGVFANIALYVDEPLRGVLATDPPVAWMDDRQLNESRLLG